MSGSAAFEHVWIASALPPRFTTFELVLDEVDAFMIAADPIDLIDAALSPWRVPVQYLPYLADDRSVDEYDSAWPEAQRRAVVAQSFRYHKKKGTRGAVQMALSLFDYKVTVTEWFEHRNRRPEYTFRLRAKVPSDAPWTADHYRSLVRIANNAKPLHTLIEGVDIEKQLTPAQVYIGGFLRIRRIIRIGIPRPEHVKLNGRVYIGAALRMRRIVRIRLPR